MQLVGSKDEIKQLEWNLGKSKGWEGRVQGRSAAKGVANQLFYCCKRCIENKM